MKEILIWVAVTINFWRLIIAYMIIWHSGAKAVIIEDSKRYAYIYSLSKGRISKLLVFQKLFRNIVWHRIYCSDQRFLAIVFQLLFPRKSDFEINGEIGSGLAVYHGHGTVINAYKIGCNFSVYQGVTVGRQSKPGIKIDIPIIGNNVTIYTNAVVAGGISIGDDVRIAAGSVVLKDVPSGSFVYGNPAVIVERKENFHGKEDSNICNSTCL